MILQYTASREDRSKDGFGPIRRSTRAGETRPLSRPCSRIDLLSSTSTQHLPSTLPLCEKHPVWPPIARGKRKPGKLSVGLDSRSSPFFPFSSPPPNSHPLHHSTSLSTLFKPSLMVELEKTPSADLSRQLSRAQSHPSIRHGFPLHSFFDPYLDPERVSSNGTVVEDGSGVIHVRLSPPPFMAGMRASGTD